jgi:hypothetical protein
MKAMGIPPDTPSLLFTLLEAYVDNPHSDPAVQGNIRAVVEAVRPPRPFRKNLIKDIAQRKLYEVLYDTIEKAYEEPHQEPTTDPKTLAAREAALTLNRTLNSAIGGALEMAIRGTYESMPVVQNLRDELRNKIIEALTPKQAELP